MDGNIFISWSGHRSRELATAIKKFVPYVIQQAKPWMSTDNIDKGSRWSDEINQALESTQVGIVCLASDNLNAPWILFESGAIAKKFQTARVCAYLLDIGPTDVALPLSQFNLTKAEKADTLELMRTLNRVLGETLDSARLEDTFNQFWPGLEKEITRIRQMPSAGHTPKRDTNDILGEVVNRLQAIESNRQLAIQEKREVNWSDVQSFLLKAYSRVGTEVAASQAAIALLQGGIGNDPKSPASHEYYKSMMTIRQNELKEKERLLIAIDELIRAKEDCKTFSE